MCLLKVAKVDVEGGVTKTKEFSPNPSLCQNKQCAGKCRDKRKRHLYIHGDAIIVVMLQIHTELVFKASQFIVSKSKVVKISF